MHTLLAYEAQKAVVEETLASAAHARHARHARLGRRRAKAMRRFGASERAIEGAR